MNGVYTIFPDELPLALSILGRQLILCIPVYVLLIHPASSHTSISGRAPILLQVSQSKNQGYYHWSCSCPLEHPRFLSPTRVL